MSQYAFCRLWEEQGNLNRAEIKSHSSPTSPVNPIGMRWRHGSGREWGKDRRCTICGCYGSEAAAHHEFFHAWGPVVEEDRAMDCSYLPGFLVSVFNNPYLILYSCNTISDVKLHIKSVCSLCAPQFICTESGILSLDLVSTVQTYFVFQCYDNVCITQDGRAQVRTHVPNTMSIRKLDTICPLVWNTILSAA